MRNIIAAFQKTGHHPFEMPNLAAESPHITLPEPSTSTRLELPQLAKMKISVLPKIISV